MSEKLKIIEALGESNLLLPALINEALSANDRAKYLFTLLQVARAHADFPDEEFTDLRQERLAAGVEDSTLDTVVAHSVKLPGGGYRIGQAGSICRMLVEDVRRMLAPVVSCQNGGDGQYSARFDSLIEDQPLSESATITGDLIDRMTSAVREERDSFHLLVMDLHKALNRMQKQVSEESIDGAQVYGIEESDRGLISAFMRGIRETIILKFDHPGLATTATRSGEKLVLQNDIGTTDAHVLVVHVRDLTVTVTYTDVHLQRLLFFQSLFDSYRMVWEDTRSRKDASMDSGVYHMGLGIYTGGARRELEDFLAFLGSRLVFLIDWNRARKRLQNFLPKDDCIRLLKWAADRNHGHMAFLKCGGERLIFDAMEFVVKGQFHIGQKLFELLGKQQARQYLQFVIRTCSEGLRQGRSESLINDEVRAELFNYFRTAHQNLLEIAATHASLVIEIASGIRDSLLRAGLEDARLHLEHNARRAKEWERQADETVNQARAAAKQTADGDFFRSLLEAADDIADDLEEAAFNLTIAPDNAVKLEMLKPLQSLSALLVQGAQEYLKIIETARYIHRGAPREDMQDFLEAIHRIMTIEHRTDEAHRNSKGVLLAAAGDFKQLWVYAETARKLEEAADGLMHAGLMLREYYLVKVMQQ